MLVLIRQICHCLKCSLYQNIINGNRGGGYGVLFSVLTSTISHPLNGYVMFEYSLTWMSKMTLICRMNYYSFETFIFF